MNTRWLPLERAVPSRAAHENDWILRGQVIRFKPLRNPLSGSELYWVYVDVGVFKLEVLVNSRALTGGPLYAGATLSAEVWLQGHVLNDGDLRSRYEGIDRSTNANFWSRFSRAN
jgi:hypothetical protein